MLNKSFTLIETIVAIFVLTAGISAIYSLVSYLISSSSVSTQTLVAAYLAQEGIEIVRNIRDTAIVSGDASNWNNTVSNCGFPGCTNFDYRSQTIPDGNCNLKNYLGVVGNFYECTSTSPIQLERKVTISQISSPPGVKVEVEVSWREKGRKHSLKAQENFYNWQQ
jgi:Tfp pilus assembly protein PilV